MTSQLQIGSVVGKRYRVDRFIGEGGMQEVYLALDAALGREVALKTPKNKSATKRFKRSAAMSAKVTHPSVAKTLDYLLDADRQFLIEEYIHGSDLKSQLSSTYQYLDPHLGAHLFHHMAKGLAALHAVGVLHRDLKPSNIMVSLDPDMSTIKITDFGIARMAAAEIDEARKDDEATMASNTVVGALPYMAPEVVRNRDAIGPAADVWSLAAILFEVLTGARPFGQGLQAVEAILRAQPPARPAILVGSVQFRHLTEELWELILACFAADPMARPTAAHLIESCGRLCYSRAPRSFGTIKRFKHKNGNWGFIEEDRTEEQTFFHADSYWRGVPSVGSRVSYARFSGEPAERAHPVLQLRDLV